MLDEGFLSHCPQRNASSSKELIGRVSVELSRVLWLIYDLFFQLYEGRYIETFLPPFPAKYLIILITIISLCNTDLGSFKTPVKYFQLAVANFS